MRIIQRTINPAEAEAILATKNNINVRKIRKQVVQKYARQMMSGKWHNSWDCIAFDKDGNLLNGQHRLMACVLSQEPITVFTVLDAEEITGDTGLKRNVVETLRGQGVEMPSVFSTNIGVAVIRDIAKVYFGVNNATADEAYEFAQYPAMQNCADVINILNGAPAGVRKASVMSAIIGGYLVTKDKRVLTFCDVLSTGVSNDGAAGGVIAIRDWLMKNNVRHIGRNDGDVIEIRAMVQASLRGYLNGVTVKRVVKRSDLIYKPNQEMFREEW